MHDGTRDEVNVSFPASTDFGRIGRVAVAGLALRLGIDIAEVEKLRVAVDRAVEALHGAGRISLGARWEPSHLSIVITNPDITIPDSCTQPLRRELGELVDQVDISPSQILLTLNS